MMFSTWLRSNAGLLLFAFVGLLVLNHYAPRAAAWLMALILVGLLVYNSGKLTYYLKG